ncbi:MAG TPA: hypothetical protein VLX29_02890 [Nitrospirota bacterium]|nr:hypothetical protein [Nitrospirota bacterium]
MAIKLGDAWGSIRGIIREALSFAEIKDLVGKGGLPIHKLAHIQQKFRGGASKGQLMDNIDELVNELDDDARDRFVVACVEDLLMSGDEVVDKLRTTMGRVGWGVSSDGVYPLRLQVELETSILEKGMQDGISKTLRRYRDGDFDGAVTAICGLVDAITEKVYTEKSLGDHHLDSYHERVSKVYRSLESEYKAPLKIMKPDEVITVWNNHNKAVNQAAYVLGAFRREYSDTHGPRNTPPELVQRAIDCAVFIIRSIGSLA